jgi:hypothetical protein
MVVFLMETRMTEERTSELQHALGFSNGEVIAMSGLSGGLALFWMKDVMVALQNKSLSHIDILLSCHNLITR